MGTSDNRLRQLQRSLGERDDQLRQSLETVGLGTWEWTPSSGEFICSPCGRALQGLAADVPLNFETFMSCVHPDDRDTLIGAMHEALHDGANFCCEYRVVGADGATHRLNGLGRVIHTGTRGSALRIAGVLLALDAGHDVVAESTRTITASAEFARSWSLSPQLRNASGDMAEADSGTQRQQQLQRFARHLQRMRELERLELAASLQQDFQEELSRVNATLLNLTRNPALTSSVREQLQQLARQTQHLREQLRERVLELAPPGIDELGFYGALRRLVDDLRERSALQISLQAPESLDRIGKSAQAALYHVAREALGNAVEHANASRIDVSVESRPDQVRLRISDDGIGLSDRARNRPNRFGLFAAAERLAQVHGALRVFGVPGNGTVVEASVNLARTGEGRQGSGGSAGSAA